MKLRVWRNEINEIGNNIYNFLLDIQVWDVYETFKKWYKVDSLDIEVWT